MVRVQDPAFQPKQPELKGIRFIEVINLFSRSVAITIADLDQCVESCPLIKTFEPLKRNREQVNLRVIYWSGEWRERKNVSYITTI